MSPISTDAALDREGGGERERGRGEWGRRKEAFPHTIYEQPGIPYLAIHFPFTLCRAHSTAEQSSTTTTIVVITIVTLTQAAFVRGGGRCDGAVCSQEHICPHIYSEASCRRLRHKTIVEPLSILPRALPSAASFTERLSRNREPLNVSLNIHCKGTARHFGPHWRILVIEKVRREPCGAPCEATKY